MKEKNILRESYKAILFMAGFGLSGAVLAQPSITVSSAAGPAGATGLTVSVEFTDTAPASTEVIDVRLDLDASIVTNIDLTGCNGNSINGVAVQCSNPNPGQVNILVFPFPPAAIDSGTLGTIGFDISNTAPIGVSPVQFIFEEYTGPGSADITPEPTDSTLGTITVQAPAGGFYSSSPAPGAELNLGEAVVNSLAGPIDTLTVDNASSDSFDITGFSSMAAELTLPAAASYSVPASGSIEFDGVSEDAVACTPSAVGANTGSFAVAHDAVGGAASPVNYGFTCKGLAPNVQVAPLSLTLDGSVGGPAPTGIFNISNPETPAETASDAQNVQLSSALDPEISIIDGLNDDLLLVDEIDSVEVSCNTAVTGMFEKSIVVAWDDPVTGAQASEEVTVTCNVTDVAPAYESVPPPGSALDFETVVEGDVSSPLGIDVGNSGSVGGADLNVTAAAISGADAAQFDLTFAPFTIPDGAAPDGTDEITVTCSPDEAGTLSAILAVNTDDPTEPAGGFTYPLACNVTAADPAYESTPPPGSTLDFEAVANDDVSSPLGVDVGNSDSVGGADLNVTAAAISGADAAQFDLTFAPFTIPDGATPDGTDEITVTCSPDEIGTFAAILVVNTDDPTEPAGGFTYPLACEGTSNAELLVIPASAVDGNLNLGTVPPGTTTSASLTLSNAGTDPLEISCTLSDDNDGIIVFDPVPAFPVTVPPEETLTFAGTPPDTGIYSELLECSATPQSARGTGAAFTTTVIVSGRPLVVPTMSRWGLIVMSLMLLLVAGFAGRRMMA